MASILFYTSIKTRVRDQESLMVEFISQGHQVYFLNQQDNFYLPTLCKRAGVIYHKVEPPTSTSTIIRTFYYCKKLVRFISAHQIDIVYSHLEPANFIAVISQFFVKAKVIIVRHHHDLAERAGFNTDISYKMTYRLARQIITVSEATKNYMITSEGVLGDKIFPIRLGYDFSIFGAVNKVKADALRQKLTNSIVLVFVGRLDEYKRPMLSLEVCKKLHEKGITSYLFFLGAGTMEDDLKKEVLRSDLVDYVSFIGYTDNVLDYLSISDWLLHPSLSESSCVVVKEAGLVELPTIVCKGVGDFESYIRHSENSLLVDPNSFVEQSVRLIVHFMNTKDERKKMGRQLKIDVMKNFDIKSILPQYSRFNNVNLF